MSTGTREAEWLKIGCTHRFSFHAINKYTGAFAKQERKNNRSLLETFLVYIT